MIKKRKTVLNPAGVSTTGASVTEVSVPCEPWNRPEILLAAAPRPETEPRRRGVITPKFKRRSGGDDVGDEE